MGRLVRCADSASGFVDPVTDFRLKRGEIKELPDGPPGKLTQQWLNAGGLKFCDTLPALPPAEPINTEEAAGVKSQEVSSPPETISDPFVGQGHETDKSPVSVQDREEAPKKQRGRPRKTAKK